MPHFVVRTALEWFWAQSDLPKTKERMAEIVRHYAGVYAIGAEHTAALVEDAWAEAQKTPLEIPVMIDPRTGAAVYARCALIPDNLMAWKRRRPKTRVLKCVWDGKVTLKQLSYRLVRILERAGANLDYFSPGWGYSFSPLSGNETWHGAWNLHGGNRWLACYAVSGTNEGHYIHIELIANTKPERRLTLWTGKTFEGVEHACDIAKLLTILLGA